MFTRIVFISIILFNSIIASGQFGPDIDQSVKLTATLNASIPSITINWKIDERAKSFDLYKRKYGDISWGEKISSFDTDISSFSDFDIDLQTLYEYKVQKYTENDVDGFGYLLSGIQIEPNHLSGQAILVITDSTYQNTAHSIHKFQNALEADGWCNRLLIIPNGLTVKEVKDEILAEYESQSFTSILLLGDVPIALSGDISPDGHAAQGGAWAADLYYGDLDGIWTDESVNNTVSPWPVNNNIPGDGKWDQSFIPSDIEIAVGRIDFSDLPVYQENEYELLSRYIDKNIAYRTQKKKIKRRAAIDNINPWEGALGQNGIRNFSTMVGPDSILYDDFDPVWNESFLWLYAASSGFHDILFLITTSQELADRSLEAVFTTFFGSRFGNYDYTNNIMRTALGSGDVLSSCWVGAPHWHFHSMAMGYTLGHATTTTQNNDTIYTADFFPRGVHVNLLGDPTLRLYPMETIENVNASEHQNYIELNWPTTNDAEGYYVYRKNINEEEYTLLNSIPIINNTYRDSCLSIGNTFVYMIRGTQLELSPSGSFYNLSSGAMDTITTTLNNLPKSSFEFEFKNDQIYLINSSENYDTIIIQGNFQVINQSDGSYILDGVENGDLITVIAKNDCATDTLSKELILNSLASYKSSLISIYPNPASSILYFECFEKILSWQVIHPNGLTKLTGNPNNTIDTIDISNLNSGYYILRVQTAKGYINKKIVIIH